MYESKMGSSLVVIVISTEQQEQHVRGCSSSPINEALCEARVWIRQCRHPSFIDGLCRQAHEKKRHDERVDIVFKRYFSLIKDI